MPVDGAPPSVMVGEGPVADALLTVMLTVTVASAVALVWHQAVWCRTIPASKVTTSILVFFMV
jgi:hypothetical protein